jgi:post-segregation antitoxin (ccd killing protein)
MASAQTVDDPTMVGSQIMRTTKISITIDTDLLEEIRAYAGRNLSRYINSALREQVHQEERNARLRELVEEDEATRGPIPAELLAEADAMFDAAEAAWRDD